MSRYVRPNLTVAPFAAGGVGDLMCRAAKTYMDEYVFSPEEGADHEPTEFEAVLLEDFWNGLISDERFFGPIRALLDAARAEGAPAAEGEIDARARVELDTDSGLPQLRIVSKQTWITWSPSVSAFGVDVPVEQLVRQAQVFAAALSTPASPPAQGVAPAAGGRKDAFVSRAEVVMMLDRLSVQHADLALEGGDNARQREAMEAAFSHAKYAVAFMPAVHVTPTPAQGVGTQGQGDEPFIIRSYLPAAPREAG